MNYLYLEENGWYVYDKPQVINIEKQDIAIIPWITAENYADTTKVLKSGLKLVWVIWKSKDLRCIKYYV